MFGHFDDEFNHGVAQGYYPWSETMILNVLLLQQHYNFIVVGHFSKQVSIDYIITLLFLLFPQKLGVGGVMSDILNRKTIKPTVTLKETTYFSVF